MAFAYKLRSLTGNKSYNFPATLSRTILKSLTGARMARTGAKNIVYGISNILFSRPNFSPTKLTVFLMAFPNKLIGSLIGKKSTVSIILRTFVIDLNG